MAIVNKKKLFADANRIDVYLAQPVKSTVRGVEPLRKQEIAIIRGKRLLAIRELGSNVLTLANDTEDRYYAFTVVKKFL